MFKSKRPAQATHEPTCKKPQRNSQYQNLKDKNCSGINDNKEETLNRNDQPKIKAVYVDDPKISRINL